MQVVAKGLLYLGMNTAGLFIHYLTDHAQRQVFLETRRCIEGRLKLEQENQRQVQWRWELSWNLNPENYLCYDESFGCINSLPWLSHCYTSSQDRLVLSILPRFVALEMIADMSAMEDDLNPQEFHKIYIHQYKDVRYTCMS